MDLFDAVQRRRSVRSFADTPVDEEELTEVLEAARRAPTAGNLQAWSVVVVTEPGTREELARACLGQEHVADAPLVLVFLADEERSAAKYGERGRSLYAVQDATIAATHALLAATAKGLGTCWVGAFRGDEVRRVIGAPEGHPPVAVIPTGHPEEELVRTSRRPLSEFVHREEW